MVRPECCFERKRAILLFPARRQHRVGGVFRTCYERERDQVWLWFLCSGFAFFFLLLLCFKTGSHIAQDGFSITVVTEGDFELTASCMLNGHSATSPSCCPAPFPPLDPVLLRCNARIAVSCSIFTVVPASLVGFRAVPWTPTEAPHPPPGCPAPLKPAVDGSAYSRCFFPLTSYSRRVLETDTLHLA